MPFIRRHLDVFLSLGVDWEWHVVEGLADLKHDTSWSLQFGGKLPEQSGSRSFLSTDGTTEYLDEIRETHPDKIRVYRKSPLSVWDGKLEMVAAPLANIREECLLWQLDCDEFWTKAQIEAVAGEFGAHPEKTAAWYWCDYFVGPDLKVCTRNCYSQNPKQEWLRTWRFRPGDRWKAHEPPTLTRRLPDGSEADLGTLNPITHNQTERLGAVFRHEAYVLESQVAFKEEYYGYKGAVHQWEKLQIEVGTSSPVLLSEYFPWVSDHTFAQRIPANKRVEHDAPGKPPMILVDGVIFQYPWLGGINRVWKSILHEWAKSGLGERITVLDRNNSFPGIPGINSVPFREWREDLCHDDSVALEKMCRDTCAEVFISTYYTTPLLTPSVALHHDFIPEMLGCTHESPIWEEKRRMTVQAARHVCVSGSTKRDLLALHPGIAADTATHALLGVSETMTPAREEEVTAFRKANSIGKPYFLIVGERVGFPGGGPVEGYKNVEIFLKAFGQWKASSEYEIVMVGGAAGYEDNLRRSAPRVQPRLLRLNDRELAVAYSGAVALVYPSKYEGFGLPVAEAMACGCPVIASNASSLPEVGGDAVVYIAPESMEDMLDAMDRVTDSGFRNKLRADGLREAGKFDWKGIASAVFQALLEASAERGGMAVLERQRDLLLKRADGFAKNALVAEAAAGRISGSIYWRATYPLRALQRLLIRLAGGVYHDY